MIEQQTYKDIQAAELEAAATLMKKEGYRLAQICATTLPDRFEVNYSFDKDYAFINYRITLSSVEISLPSITKIYWNAFIYENEIQDLFGIRIKGMAVDYHGQFYKTTVKVPFGAVKIEKKR